MHIYYLLYSVYCHISYLSSLGFDSNLPDILVGLDPSLKNQSHNVQMEDGATIESASEINSSPISEVITIFCMDFFN